MGFYDAKGYWRNDGDGFYDAKGYWRNPGNGFYDAKGYWRNPGSGFYDFKGNWVNPGGSYYDGKGYRRIYSIGEVTTPSSSQNIVVLIAFMLFLPIGIVWMATTFFIQWVSYHLYIIYFGYIALDVLSCLIITKVKKHRGVQYIMSFMGNFLCILSLIYIAVLYAVPYMLANGGSFASFFEFTLVLATGIGGIFILQFFNYYHGKSFLEFILGVLFFCVVIIILKKEMMEWSTMERLIAMYHIKSQRLFIALFGFGI